MIIFCFNKFNYFFSRQIQWLIFFTFLCMTWKVVMLIELPQAILTHRIVNLESFLSGLFCIISSIEIWFISIKVDIDHKTYTPQLLKIHNEAAWLTRNHKKSKISFQQKQTWFMFHLCPPKSPQFRLIFSLAESYWHSWWYHRIVQNITDHGIFSILSIYFCQTLG